MLNPLTQFICDTCNQIIESPDEGCFERIKDTDANEIHSFRITHHSSKSPIEGSGCYQHKDAKGRVDNNLRSVLQHLIPELLAYLDPGVYHDPDNRRPKITDIRNYVETFRRLTIPYYEEARKYWSEAIDNHDFDKENEISIYKEETLRRIIEKYSEY